MDVSDHAVSVFNSTCVKLSRFFLISQYSLPMIWYPTNVHSGRPVAGEHVSSIVKRMLALIPYRYSVVSYNMALQLTPAACYLHFPLKCSEDMFEHTICTWTLFELENHHILVRKPSHFGLYMCGLVLRKFEKQLFNAWEL